MSDAFMYLKHHLVRHQQEVTGHIGTVFGSRKGEQLLQPVHVPAFEAEAFLALRRLLGSIRPQKSAFGHRLDIPLL